MIWAMGVLSGQRFADEQSLHREAVRFLGRLLSDERPPPVDSSIVAVGALIVGLGAVPREACAPPPRQ
jgi:hypothetical protein